MAKTLKAYAVEALVYRAPERTTKIVMAADEKTAVARLQKSFSEQGATDVQVERIEPVEVISPKATEPATPQAIPAN